MGIYAKTGVTFQGGEGYVYTGNANGAHWQVDKPASGALIHGITTTFVDEFSFYPSINVFGGPLYVQISVNMAIGDEMAISTGGSFKKRGTSDALAGIALSNGSAGNTCIMGVYGTSTPFNLAGLIQGDIFVMGASGWERYAPGTAGQVLTSNGAAAKPTYQGIPSATARSFANPSRTLNSAFQISTTRDAFVSYSVNVSVISALIAGQSGTVFLEYADDNGFTTNVKTVAEGTNATGGVLNITNIGTVNVGGIIPTNKYVRLRTANNTGTPTFTFMRCQEVLL